MLDLPERTKKNRSVGITSIHDVGITLGELEFILKDYSDFVDFAKLGVGTAYITPRLDEKIALYKLFNVEVYFGGTLFEKYYSQNLFDDYLLFLEKNNINWIEVSNGTVDISLDERIQSIKVARSRGFNVISEVGCKDDEMIMAPSQWIDEILSVREAGCKYIITEGRDSGSAGLYRGSGEIRTGLLADIISSADTKYLIFEAPIAKAQMYFINAIGANVNLGNISPHDLLILETQRRSLRCETFYNDNEYYSDKTLTNTMEQGR